MKRRSMKSALGGSVVMTVVAATLLSSGVPSNAASPAKDLTATQLPVGRVVTAEKSSATTAGKAPRATALVSLDQSCAPTTIEIEVDRSVCTISAVNTSPVDQVVDLVSKLQGDELIGTAIEGATPANRRRANLDDVTLAAAQLAVPSLGPGTIAGYVPLDAFGISPQVVGDEELVPFFGVAPFVYNGQTWDSFTVFSNGYLEPGIVDSNENNCCNLPNGPSPAAPNNLLAPFWTDLTGDLAPGIYVGVLTDGVSDWNVIEFRLNLFGTTDLQIFQIWLGANGAQDIVFAYPQDDRPTAGPQPFLVGAENAVGQGDMEAVIPAEDQRVTSSEFVPGGSALYSFTVKGRNVGSGGVGTRLRVEGGEETSLTSTITVIDSQGRPAPPT